MKRQNCGPCLGKLVHQLLEVIILAYDLRLDIIIPRFENLKEKIEKKQIGQFEMFLVSSFSLKTLFSASKRL